ncbi:ClpXP adapter SpxH family protein [Shouchella lehensis]|uniref:ClpXP adapter protein SpxH n=2 Tax=Shouchella lehensis TaxID=300825 RepID=A0A060LUZ8_9BACI|nr:ClpXP adapter SpxH family protein [Shouchella lehensis]AIC95086.1 dithiol-disulfide isomerase [Shouchella lehensis G1]RQW20908.1 DsbA family protein [Bacillus sp. C1-1]TES50932.1 DsbA family protein [Shouchella lehensis]
MNLKRHSFEECNQEMGICGISDSREQLPLKKPIEIYFFIDPLCHDCWTIEPIIKKFQIEYGHYFKVRILLAGKLSYWNAFNRSLKKKNKQETQLDPTMCCAGKVELNKMDINPYNAYIAVKAAELQGPHAGLRFLRKLREALFLRKCNVTDEAILKQCSKEAGLDVDIFLDDLHSKTATKALQCDIQTTSEMDVESVPSLVFFNGNSEEAGIKISGHYPYHIYVQLLEDMLGFTPERASHPNLEAFLCHYGFLATSEIATVLDKSPEEVERSLKSLMLQQKVEAVPFKYGTFWKWIA